MHLFNKISCALKKKINKKLIIFNIGTILLIIIINSNNMDKYINYVIYAKKILEY